jgi:hypothetical protein
MPPRARQNAAHVKVLQRNSWRGRAVLCLGVAVATVLLSCSADSTTPIAGLTVSPSAQLSNTASSGVASNQSGTCPSEVVIGGQGCVPCAVIGSVRTAEKVPTVGILAVATDLPDLTEVRVQFGKTTSYGLEAALDVSGDAAHGLLLGMPANTDVHYRVLAFGGSDVCVSSDAMFRTGALNSDAPASVSPLRGKSEPAPGFILAEQSGYAYVVNQDGEVVWAYRFPKGVIRSLLSWDGKYLFARDEGPFAAATGGNIYRVGMDGEGERRIDVPGGHHHDLAMTPRGIVYIAKNDDEVMDGVPIEETCDKLYAAELDGAGAHVIADLNAVFGKFRETPGSISKEKCHVNAVRYYHDTDSFSVSDRDKDAIGLISATGEVLGSIGTAPVETTPNHVLASGADGNNDAVWRVQHGHEQYAANKLVLFSNGSLPKGHSQLLHYTIEGSIATLDWQYADFGNSVVLGDAQHVFNGNFLVTNSVSGDVHEVDSAGKWVQTFKGLSRGYTQHRPTLYGAPPGR